MNRKKLTAIIGGVGAAALVATAGSAFTQSSTGLVDEMASFGGGAALVLDVDDVQMTYVNSDEISTVTFVLGTDIDTIATFTATLEINGAVVDDDCLQTVNPTPTKDTFKCATDAGTGINTSLSGMSTYALGTYAS